MPSAQLRFGDRTQRLTEKEEAFAQDAAKGMPLAQAYRKHYSVSADMTPNTVSTKASQLAGRVKVHARIMELKAKVRAAANREFEYDGLEWFKQAVRLAHADPRNLFHPDGKPKAPHELDDNIAQAIVGVRVSANGVEYKLQQKAPIMDQIARRLGLFEADNRQRAEAALQAFIAQIGYAGKMQAKQEVPALESLPPPTGGQITAKE